jgi:hypothetical protein
VTRIVLVLALVAALSMPAAARADGDPASDVLVYKNIYLPYAAPARSAASALEQGVAEAYARGLASRWR